MKSRSNPCRIVLTLAVAYALASSPVFAGAMPSSETPVLAEPNSTTILLVRHAEKETNGASDPALTAVGEERADRLAQLLHPFGVTHVWSSDYRRCRDTAAPLLEASGLELELYDPRNLPALVERLRATPGRHLVVGHSNTTPALAELLGGDGGEPIYEPSEYDRLYLLVLGAERSETFRFSY